MLQELREVRLCESQTFGTGQIRVVSITDLQFVPFSDIIIRNRIF